MMNNKYVRILLSFAIAFGLWLYVITVEVPEDEVTFTGIPITFSNENTMMEERNLMVVSESVPTINLTLKGSRTELNKLSSSNISAIVELSQVLEPGNHWLTYKIGYPPEVTGNAFEVISYTPSSIMLEVEKRLTRNIPVVVLSEGAVPDGYFADTESVVLDIPTVEIKGPASVVEQITQALITVDLTDRTESVVENYQYTLCNAENEAVDAKMVTTNAGEIAVKLKIQTMKEVPLVLDVKEGGGATEATSSINIEPKSIFVTGSDAVLADLNEILIGSIDLSTELEDFEKVFTIPLDDNVNNLSEINEAKVTVQFPNLAKKTLEVTNIQTTNVPEGFEVELLTKVLSVQVRGPRDKVATLEAADIVAVIDLTNSQTGSTNYTAQIQLGEQYEQVGAVGTYSVSATLREKTEETN